MKLSHLFRREPAKNKYAVAVKGENFLIRFDEEVMRCGFYTTRYVQADNPGEAVEIAMGLIREELKDQVFNDPTDSPMMYEDGITELASFKGVRAPGSGFTFYTVAKGEEDGG